MASFFFPILLFDFKEIKFSIFYRGKPEDGSVGG